MKILIIGSGGREHAMAWRIAQSPSVEALYVSPGNPGLAQIAKCLPANPATPEVFVQVAESVDADLTVVGPEVPLVAGIVDLFQSRGRRIVGPNARAAQLEGSKIFAKQFMDRAGVPTARFASVDNEREGLKALEAFSYPVVLKADGLAAGKGVVIAEDKEDAKSVLSRTLSGQLVGEAGSRLVIEEFLTGEEVSYIVLSDGRDVLSLAPTQDHKAVHDGDSGPNTGGMGAYCDERILTAEEERRVLEAIVMPSIEQMRADGNPFTGFLYCGLMMTAEGPKVLEYNVRLGDPETQCLMHRAKNDFAEVLMAAAHSKLAGCSVGWHSNPSVCVVMAAAGYPSSPRKGDRIEGIAEAESTGATVFHAGTRLGESGLETSGGRVLGVTASGEGLAEAIERAYAAVRTIRFEGMHYRTDIGQKGLKRWPTTN